MLDNGHPLTMHTHQWTLMASKYWGQLFIVQVARLRSALHTRYCVLRTVPYAADPHCGCPRVWLEYLHRTFLRHSKAVNPALNMFENVNNGDLSVPMFGRRTPAIS